MSSVKKLEKKSENFLCVGEKFQNCLLLTRTTAAAPCVVRDAEEADKIFPFTENYFTQKYELNE